MTKINIISELLLVALISLIVGLYFGTGMEMDSERANVKTGYITVDHVVYRVTKNLPTFNE